MSPSSPVPLQCLRVTRNHKKTHLMNIATVFGPIGRLPNLQQDPGRPILGVHQWPFWGSLGSKNWKKIFVPNCLKMTPNGPKTIPLPISPCFSPFFASFHPQPGGWGCILAYLTTIWAHECCHWGAGCETLDPPQYVKFGQKTCKNAHLMALGTILDHFGVIWDEIFFRFLDPKRP